LDNLFAVRADGLSGLVDGLLATYVVDAVGVDCAGLFHESGADEWGPGASIDRLPVERTATHTSTIQIKTTFFIRA
jgi:hypothetical protein